MSATLLVTLGFSGLYDQDGNLLEGPPLIDP